MRIVLHGQQAFGQAVLEKLLERGEDVVAVCCAPTKEGKPEDVLATYARGKGLPMHQPASWTTPEAMALMKSFEADVCMMAYVLLFVPEAVLNAPKYGTFQYHPSLCPLHRGPSSINWPIAMGKDRTGLSIFWPDDGLDEGPIMLQKTCAIGPDETLGDVYFKKLFPLGVDAMLEGLDLVKSGVIIKHDQRLDDGTYEGWFGKKEAELVGLLCDDLLTTIADGQIGFGIDKSGSPFANLLEGWFPVDQVEASAVEDSVLDTNISVDDVRCYLCQ